MAAPATGQALPVSDRRKIQNRMAQRRFRQKRATENRVAGYGADNYWQDADGQNFSITGPHEITISGVSQAPSQFQTASHFHANATYSSYTQSRDARASSLTFEPGTLTWDGQLFGDVCYLGNPQTEMIAPPSPPNSSSPTTPDNMNNYDDGQRASSQGAEGTAIARAIDDNAMLRAMFPPASGANSPRASAGASARHPILMSQELRAQVRKNLAAEWKASKHPRPTWSKGRDEPKEPLLHTASKKGNCEILHMLITHNADINERDSLGRTALHVAIEYQQEEVIMWLLENGVDINAYDGEGRTALSMAVNNCCESGVRLFLLHGADPMLKTPEKTVYSPN